MIVKWSKDGDSGWSLEFDKFNLKNIFRINKSSKNKGIDSFFEKNVWILGFKYSYVNVNYDDIVFIEIKPENNYSSDENNEKVQTLKATLKNWLNTGNYRYAHPAFNWNYAVDRNNEYIYFLTGPKKWFIDNGLKCLTNGLREITFNHNTMRCFPRYNPNTTNKVNNVLV